MAETLTFDQVKDQPMSKNEFIDTFLILTGSQPVQEVVDLLCVELAYRPETEAKEMTVLTYSFWANAYLGAILAAYNK